MRILVVEDDRKVARFIQSGLEQEGYAADVLYDGSDAGEQALAVDYDAVVLDLMLPGRSGFEVLRDIRARKAQIPVLILTAKATVEERVAGLDGGADDYMAKPFALAELSARLRALVVNAPNTTTPFITYTLTNALITSFQTVGSLSSFVDVMSFAYERIRTDVTVNGVTTTTCWDLALVKSC